MSVDENSGAAAAVAEAAPDTRDIAPATADWHFVLAWSLAAAILLADLAWFPVSRLSIVNPQSLAMDLAVLLGLGLCYIAMLRVGARVAGDMHYLGRAIALVCERGTLTIQALIFKAVLFGSVAVFTYLAAALGWPLRDADLAQIDRWLGFDWPAFVTLVNGNDVFARVLVFAYKSIGVQLILLILLLGLSGRRARLAELLLLLSLTVAATILIYLVIPAAGAYAHYLPDTRLFHRFSADAGMWHYETLLSLRNAPAAPLDFANPQGLVVFPSFHTVLALMMPYAVRDMRWLFFPVVALNALMIVATVPEGGHHLIDVIAGMIIFGLALVVVRMRVGG